MKVLFFEDPSYRNFEPLSLSRPPYTLLCGTSKIYKKWLKSIKCEDYGFLCRPYLANIVNLETGKSVNEIPEGDFLAVNGRFLPSKSIIEKIEGLKSGEALICDDYLLALKSAFEADAKLKKTILNLYTTEGHENIKSIVKVVRIEANNLQYIWNLVEFNPRLITEEFARFREMPGRKESFPQDISIIGQANIYIHESVEIAPSVVIDASAGPVIIEEKTRIEPFSFIQGPCYIGPDCRIVGGRIRSGTSLGPTCRVGGEVEESIMLGYCNKYHEGFLGHACLGEWVNLGALTTNSDLKNNYKEITVEIGGENVQTESIKIGSFIGDHTKTGIGTMLNTGINIGFSCNLYGAGLFSQKLINSFSWGEPGKLQNYRVDKAIETAEISMNRRGMAFTQIHKKLFEDIQKLT
jgi:UDP-N-acetylglucosamine diphosphorylase/glucosamine-1-phosphate N-acetyltransferase